MHYDQLNQSVLRVFGATFCSRRSTAVRAVAADSATMIALTETAQFCSSKLLTAWLRR